MAMTANACNQLNETQRKSHSKLELRTYKVGAAKAITLANFLTGGLGD